MTKPLYLSDVQAAKQRDRDAQAVRWAKEDVARAKREAKFQVATNLHPAIGVLINAKGVRYYAHIGAKRVYTEGTPAQLTAMLEGGAA